MIGQLFVILADRLEIGNRVWIGIGKRFPDPSIELAGELVEAFPMSSLGLGSKVGDELA